MEIQEIKEGLTLSQVLKYYNLKPDKQLRLNCPFHDDKTPSLQVYYKTHTAYCFSSNCKTHGKSLDVIDFIMHKENITKHEAILKAQEMLNVVKSRSAGITGESSTGTTKAQPKQEASRTVFLTQMFTYFKNAIHNSKPAQEYLQKRKLDNSKTEVGYNSGQFHHGARKDENLINTCLQYGLLLDLGTKARTGDAAYKPFGKWGLVFPLKNKQNEIVSLYFRSTLDDKNQRHFYLKDRQGLYPSYPTAEAKKLILTESIIDAATLRQAQGSALSQEYEVLALYGTNGLTDEHQQAIKELNQLEEIIFFLNGDPAGIKSIEKYAPMLKADYPTIKITNVEVPENEDVNSLLQGHSPEILTHLIESRKEYNFIFSIENQLKEKATEEVPVEQSSVPPSATEPQQTGLDANNPYNLKYTGNEANYNIKGFNINQLDSLKITLQISVK